MTGPLSHAPGFDVSVKSDRARVKRGSTGWAATALVTVAIALPGAAAAGLLGPASIPGPVAPAAAPASEGSDPAPAEPPQARPSPPAPPAPPAETFPASPAAASTETTLAPEVAAPGPPAPPAPATPAAAPATTPGPAPATGTPSPAEKEPARDELAEAGYLPGYRRAKTLGMSPYAPAVGGMPGGVTPAFGSPTPPSGWSFKWNGFLSASLQTSLNRRPQPLDGQSTTVFHIPARTLDEYASFVGTNTMPGNWAALNFEYGGKVVSANFSINTWNPSQPSTYYQVGSQYFINNAYLSFAVPPIAGVALRANVGYFYNTYGSLSQYGLGMYQNSIMGSPRGVGETLLAEYALTSSLSIVVEDGLLGTRNGRVPTGVVANSANGNANPLYPASWVHHLHLGVIKKGEPTLRAQIHYMTNWSRDDRGQMATDNPVTRQVDESYLKDGHVDVFGADATVGSNVWGYLGAAASFTRGENAALLRGLITYGGDGPQLADRWWGGPTGGTGSLMVAGINYAVSVGKIVAHPTPFNGDGPDLLVSTGFVIARSNTTFEPYDRVRHKYGLDVLYKFLPWLGAGVRGDRVVPTSRDSGETFHVIAPRLVFRTDWQSRESITLLYAKWFYGPRSHPEASASMTPDKIDDQLLALNVNMWW